MKYDSVNPASNMQSGWNNRAAAAVSNRAKKAPEPRPIMSPAHTAATIPKARMADGLPPVWADQGAVLRIFTNLIRNALDHGAGRLEVRLYREGDGVVSQFSNDAPDMAQADVSHVFDRFFTSDKMRTGRNTGLGLAIVKTLALQMGHTPQASLEEGRFTVRIRWKC